MPPETIISSEGTTPPPAPQPEAPPKETEVEFDLSFLDEDEEKPQAAIEEEKPAPKPELPAEPAAEQPAKKVESEEQPKETEEEKPKEEEVAPQELTEERIAELRSKFLEDVTKSYELSPEEAAQANEDVGAVLSKVAGKAHVRIYEEVMRTIYAQLPSVLSMMQANNSRLQSAEDAFFEKWPALKGQGEAVGRLAKAYRGANPEVTMEQAIDDIGAIAMHRLGLSSAPKEAPKATPKVKREAVEPHTPAKGSRQNGAGTPANVFEELAMYEEKDDA